MPAASNSRTESGVPRPNPRCDSSTTKYPPGGITVPAGSLLATWVSSLSRMLQPEMSAGLVPVLMSSTQSPGVPPFDSTSLMRTVAADAPPQRFAAPLVDSELAVNAPVPFGQRPYVTAACSVHEYESITVPEGLKSRTLSAAPRPKPNAASSST